ncbi:MAG: hypothetical protein ACI4N3_03040 [Alphaproteobacteria bacterium]
MDKKNKVLNTKKEDKQLTPQKIAKLALKSLDKYKKSYEYLKDK